MRDIGAAGGSDALEGAAAVGLSSDSTRTVGTVCGTVQSRAFVSVIY